jgi:hypothetical protein
MKQMRTELRRTLQWCLEQPDAFEVVQYRDHSGITHASIGRQFRTLEALGLIGRTITNQNHHLYWIKDYAAVKKALNCERVASVPVPKRRGMPSRIINSVFALGAA